MPSEGAAAARGIDAFGMALLQAAPDPILVVDDEGVIVLANRQTRSTLGYEPDELVGRSIELLVPERMRGAHLAHRAAFRGDPRVRPMGAAMPLVARRQDGSELPVEISLSPIVLDGRRLVIAIVRDVTERRQAEERLRHLSVHDALTGLHNRAFFEEELARLRRGRRWPVGVVMADLNGLKRVNDEEGHAAGDEVLRRAADLLRASFRGEDVVARIGGDEFVVLLPGADRAALAEAVGRIRVELARQHGTPVDLEIGCAVAFGPDELADAVQAADLEMLGHKRRSRP